MQTHSINAATTTVASQQSRNAFEIFKEIALVCPISDAPTSDIITVVIDEKHNLGKQFSVGADGAIKKTSAVSISRGIACQYHVPDHSALEALLRIVSEHPNAAIINAGFSPAALGEIFVFLSKKALAALGLEDEAVTTDGGMKAFARLKVHATPSTWQLLDRDEDHMTPEWAKEQSFDKWRINLDKILPGVLNLKMLLAHSSSARVLNADGTPVGGGNGHAWIKTKDALDAERTRASIMARALEFDLSWPKPRISKTTGQECGRGIATIIDASVWTVGRLIFVGSPTCTGGLTITPQKFDVINGLAEVLDTSQAVINEFKTVRASARQGVRIALSQTRTTTGKVTGYTIAEANLTLDTELELEDGSLTTVRAALASYNGKIRCQAPFRASTSMAAFFAIDDSGKPFVFDSGTDTKHILAKPVRKADKHRDRMIRDVKQRLADLIGPENADLVIDEEALCDAWQSMFYNPTSSKVVFLNDDHQLTDMTVTEVTNFGFELNFGSIIHLGFLRAAVREKNLNPEHEEELLDEAKKIAPDQLLKQLRVSKQAKSLAVSVDIFAAQGSMSVSDGIATVALPHRCFAPPQLVDQLLVDSVVADYSQHFAEFQDFLDLVLHARFASDRRQAFVWLHSASSWGKGFLVSIFTKLGLVVEVSTKEIDKALEGGPVGLSMNDTLRAWILFVDEFKAASSELKLLNTQVTLSPKNQLRCTVPLYTKLFASAENVRSLVADGVESQFNNRFAYLAPSTNEQKIEDRKLFKDLGKLTYINAMVTYVASYLNAGVERMRALGAIAASKAADEYLATYQAAHRLQDTFGNLDEAVEDVVDEIKNCLVEYGLWMYGRDRNVPLPDVVQGIGPQLLATLKRTAVTGWVSEGDNSKNRRYALVLGDGEKFVKSYLALSGDRSTVGKMQYKTDVIATSLHMRPDPYTSKIRVYSAKDGGVVTDKRGIVIFVQYPHLLLS